MNSQKLIQRKPKLKDLISNKQILKCPEHKI